MVDVSISYKIVALLIPLTDQVHAFKHGALSQAQFRHFNYSSLFIFAAALSLAFLGFFMSFFLVFLVTTFFAMLRFLSMLSFFFFLLMPSCKYNNNQQFNRNLICTNVSGLAFFIFFMMTFLSATFLATLLFFMVSKM